LDAGWFTTQLREKNNTQYERAELEKLLKESDIVSIHAPLNNNTRGLIDYERLRMMKKRFGKGAG